MLTEKKQPQLSAEETLRIANQLTTELGKLEVNDDPKRKVIRGIFEDSNNYMKSGTLMLAVIEKLEEAINFHDFKERQHLKIEMANRWIVEPEKAGMRELEASQCICVAYKLPIFAISRILISNLTPVLAAMPLSARTAPASPI